MAWQIPIANTNGVTDLGTTSNLYVAKPIVIGGVIASGSNQQVIVDGTIASFGDGIRFSGGSSTTFGNRITVNADGVVRGFGGTGILTSCYDTTIINKGYVFGGSNGVQLNGISGTTTSTLENSGTIESDHYGVARRGGSTETISIVNTGTISGAQFSFGQFNGDSVARDLITNKGMMIGNINLGGGNDLYDGRLGTVIGDVLGGDGIDQINTDAGNNKLFGEAGNDTLMGGAGGDFLNGGAGDDLASYAFATAGVIANLLVPATNTGDAAGDTYDSIE